MAACPYNPNISGWRQMDPREPAGHPTQAIMVSPKFNERLYLKKQGRVAEIDTQNQPPASTHTHRHLYPESTHHTHTYTPESLT